MKGESDGVNVCIQKPIHTLGDCYCDWNRDWGGGSHHPRKLGIRRLNIVERVLLHGEALAKPRTTLFVPREDGVDTTRGGKGAIGIPLTGDAASVLQGPPGPYVTDLRKHLGQGRETGQPRETKPRVRSHEEPCQKGNIHLYIYVFYLMGGWVYGWISDNSTLHVIFICFCSRGSSWYDDLPWICHDTYPSYGVSVF